ncbi:MAG: Anthranilate phosphoribosyltransferase [Pedosphaera sp.]|nr:Anthranilate phosphoribosyltransferase [Pedosphaera sp.]
MLKLFNQQLAGSVHLTDDQVAAAVAQLVDEAVPAELKADFLCELARKIETPQEIAAFARELRAKSIQPPLDPETRAREILDVCGTGGDRLNTFNISTTVAIVCAAAGVTVAKHGNRAITSQAGSADVLEALGIRIELTPEEAAQSLRDHHFAFFFAPNYHPTFKHISAARKLCAQRGQRTIFNFLGPLLNPARPTAQLVGVPRPELCETLAQVIQSLGVRRGMVVCGRVGDAWLDELSTLGDTTLAEFYHDRGFSASTISPTHFPLQPATLADLTGSDRKANAAIVRRLLQHEDRGPKLDAVLLNAGAALFVAGKVRSVNEGWDHALDLIATGKARAKLNELIAG